MEVGLNSLIGTEIAGYRIEALLGRGGMSVVYRAEDLALGRKVALKLMSPELSENEDFRDRFRMEWRRAASIDHPNVIPIYEAGDHDGQLFIAMRYVEGTDLKALLEEEGALEPSRAVNLLSQAAEGLDAAHNRGLVHRDVKPSNLLISREGDKEHAYLADFGLTKPASTAEEARESIQLSGTTDYVSPEQIADGTADASSDIYALGALLYESLTGEVPYPRDRKLQVLFAHVNDPPPKPTEVTPELPDAIDGVIAKAMAKEPENRYATGAELASAATVAFPVAKRPRWQIAALVVALALLIAAAIAIPAILLTGGNGEQAAEPLPPVTENSLVRIDPETNAPISSVELDIWPGFDSSFFWEAEGSLWAMDGPRKELTQINLEREEIVRTVDLATAVEPLFFSVGGGFVWVTDGQASGSALNPSGDSVVLKYDLETQETTTINVEGAGWVSFDDGVLWVVGGSQVEKLDPVSGETRARIPIPNCSEDCFPWGFAFTGAVWVVYATDPAETFGTGNHAILRVDPQTNEILTDVELDFQVDWMWTAEDGAWLLDRQGATVTHVDAETNSVSKQFPVYRDPQCLARGAGALWVTHGRDAVVTRIDPVTLDQTVIDLPGIPGCVAAGQGGVWVSVRPG